MRPPRIVRDKRVRAGAGAGAVRSVRAHRPCASRGRGYGKPTHRRAPRRRPRRTLAPVRHTRRRRAAPLAARNCGRCNLEPHARRVGDTRGGRRCLRRMPRRAHDRRARIGSRIALAAQDWLRPTRPIRRPVHGVYSLRRRARRRRGPCRGYRRRSFRNRNWRRRTTRLRPTGSTRSASVVSSKPPSSVSGPNSLHEILYTNRAMAHATADSRSSAVQCQCRETVDGDCRVCLTPTADIHRRRRQSARHASR